MRLRSAFLGLALAVLPLLAARADVASSAPGAVKPGPSPVIITSRGGGFSAVYPMQPQAPSGEPHRLPGWVGGDFADDGTAMWMTGFAISDHESNANYDLISNAYTIAQSMHGEVKTHDWTDFVRGPNDTLPAYSFTAESDALRGKGLIVVDGKRIVLIVAMIRKPGNLSKAADDFLNSLHIDKLPN